MRFEEAYGVDLPRSRGQWMALGSIALTGSTGKGRCSLIPRAGGLSRGWPGASARALAGMVAGLQPTVGRALALPAWFLARRQPAVACRRCRGWRAGQGREARAHEWPFNRVPRR